MDLCSQFLAVKMTFQEGMPLQKAILLHEALKVENKKLQKLFMGKSTMRENRLFLSHYFVSGYQGV